MNNQTMMTPTSTATTDLTLYELSGDLTELLAERESMEGMAEDPTELDRQIALYMEALPTKVDGVAHVLKMFKMFEQASAEEERRLKARMNRFRNMRERLEHYISIVLARLPFPKHGKARQLEGRTATLQLRQNGGIPELVIKDERLVPNEYCVFKVELSHSEYLQALELMGIPAIKNAERVIDNKALRRALESRCVSCSGTGSVRDGSNCVHCAGSGYQVTAGASLERGFHVRLT
jgi:hypothetical protein